MSGFWPSERRRTEIPIVERSRHFHDLFDHAPVGMALVSPAGLLTEVNPAFCDLFGFERNELVGHGFEDAAFAPCAEGGTSLAAYLAAPAVPCTPLDVEGRRKDGTAVWVSVHAVPFTVDLPGRPHTLAVVHDVTQRRQAHADAVARERHLRAVIAALPWCLKVVSLDGTIQEMNPAGLRVLEADRADQVVGANFIGFADEQTREQFAAYARGVANGAERGAHEFLGVTLKGRPLWLETTAVPLHDDAGLCQALVAATHDVTSRKQRELLLEQQTLAMEAALDGMAVLDDKAEFVYLNQAHVTLFGYEDRQALVGHSWRDLYHADEVRRIEHEVFPILQRDGRWVGEATGRRRDGTTFPEGLSLTAMPGGGLICVCRDITTQKRLEERLRLVVEAAPSAMVMVDPHGQIAMVNAEAERLFGYARQELVGQSMEILVPERYRDGHHGERAGFLRAPRARAMGAGRDLHALRKDGTEFPVEIGLNPISTEDGVLVLGAIVDITERKRAQDRLESSLREKDLLLKEIHHRVKNNLQLISSLLHLQAGYPHSAEVLHALGESQQRIHAVALVHESLYAAPHLGQLEFADYVQRLVQHLSRVCGLEEKGIAIDTTLTSLPLPLDTAIPCGLILHELLTNCAKHAFPQGRRGTIRIVLERALGRTWRLTVSDDGTGATVDLNDARCASLGLRVIRTLAGQLDATLMFQTGSQGTTARLAREIAE